MKLKTIMFAVIVTLALSSFVSALGSNPPGAQLVGTWVVTVNVDFPGFPPSFTALETYSRGGGMTTSNNLPPVPRPGQGSWEKKGQEYSVTILFFAFDQNAQTGSIRVRHHLALTGQDEFSGAGQAEFFDLNGGLLFTVPFTTTGHRLAIEPL